MDGDGGESSRFIFKKIVDDFKNLKPKMTAFVLQSITPAGEEKIKERYRPEWTKR
jgi:hypothetical protein